VAYLYETHLHTAGVSKCAISIGSDYIAGYKKKGYTGLIVTDHFYNANCAISRKLPWEKWVEYFYSGYENAKEKGDLLDFDVFFGWEETFDGCDDYLIYGLDKEWLLAHPECKTWTRLEQYRAVRDAGGCVVQAHPFRQRAYIPRIVLSTGCVDAVEVVNGGHEDFSFDALANSYAKKLGKPVTAGTDIHDAADIIYGETFGIYSENKLNSINDYVNLVLNNEIAGLKVEKGRLNLYGTEEVAVPVEIRDEYDNITGRSLKEFL